MTYVNIDLNQMILSKVRGQQTVTKVRIRPVLLKEELFFRSHAQKAPGVSPQLYKGRYGRRCPEMDERTVRPAAAAGM